MFADWLWRLSILDCMWAGLCLTLRLVLTRGGPVTDDSCVRPDRGCCKNRERLASAEFQLPGAIF